MSKLNRFHLALIVINFTIVLFLSAWVDYPHKKICDKFHNSSAGWMYMGETAETCIYMDTMTGDNIEIVK